MKKLLALILAALTLGSAAADVEQLDAGEAHKQVQGGTLTLVDVRRASEWSQTGMPQGAVGATLQDSDFVDQVLRAVNGDKNAPVAVICRSGNRSTAAADQLEAAGFSDVYNVKEGVAGRNGVGPGWLARDLPVKD